MSDPPLHQPRDKFFKKAFSNQDAARGIFEAYLPREVCLACDFDSLELSAASFVDEHLRGSQSDLLYQVRMSGSPACL